MNDSSAPALDDDDSSRTDDGTGDLRLGARAARTRNAILEASKQLFLERGYSGTRINNITDACGISRAGFYTYFRDKREIFNTLGEETYHELLDVVARWDTIPQPCTREDVETWVRGYFAFMDKHGAFILSAQPGPSDEDVKIASTRMQMRVVWLLGMNLRNRQRHPAAAPEALGLCVQAMLDRSWYLSHTQQQLPVDPDDIVRTATDFLMAILTA
ncbi:TetR/AcrR family transcriptional regulator [Nocardia nova]|uniref:TetR/AcrR family transcriptional regulator n=1 Tax=Nocardia nova TaxID=37330 RepID=A0A2S6A6P3_9NOCA|nr:TetR/AcrR family transcriptional regulator [Nocardia nova]MBV7706994.1 TetR/AcrR family transcriptional regulator [Nocardia nova]PPI94094.1 TetR/AcrR family transcriptional regulator [Nocardia nova]PPJ26550.1 TetR/AcrR family transcriptional regulator [Nocardia nova]PPJ28168.1 TetR/AcrR family transcriptional regulator [Nocardia nova]PPJ37350.1 TetR/AcrR family transcriptional regulator [Nocardia nova]